MVDKRFFSRVPANAGPNVVHLRKKVWSSYLEFNVDGFPFSSNEKVPLLIGPFDRRKEALLWCQELETLFKKPRKYTWFLSVVFTKFRLLSSNENLFKEVPFGYHVPVFPHEVFLRDFEKYVHLSVSDDLEHRLGLIKEQLKRF